MVTYLLYIVQCNTIRYAIQYAIRYIEIKIYYMYPDMTTLATRHSVFWQEEGGQKPLGRPPL